MLKYYKDSVCVCLQLGTFETEMLYFFITTTEILCLS